MLPKRRNLSTRPRLSERAWTAPPRWRASNREISSGVSQFTRHLPDRAYLLGAGDFRWRSLVRKALFVALVLAGVLTAAIAAPRGHIATKAAFDNHVMVDGYGL